MRVKFVAYELCFIIPFFSGIMFCISKKDDSTKKLLIGSTALNTSRSSSVTDTATVTTALSSSAPSALSFSGSPFSFLQGAAITTITPTVAGTITSCTSSPSLPSGLIINSTTCAISGMPTTAQASANYTISAGNSAGNKTASIGILITSNGSSWTARTLPSSSGWTSVTYGNGIFVTVSTSTAAASSTDGITWTARTLPSSSNWSSVTYGNGVFVTLANSSSTAAASSTDGITWTARTLPSSQPWTSVT
ncbi:MAG TPA: Ig domain-containing protein, partial [Leptospiraceae bacterium]|nr:Ig domain-containing protein [Leptospiraceae bacterium]